METRSIFQIRTKIDKENSELSKLKKAGSMWLSAPNRYYHTSSGELAQMVERSLSMREVRGSMPRFSKYWIFLLSAKID